MNQKSHCLQNTLDTVKLFYTLLSVYYNVYTHSSVTAPPVGLTVLMETAEDVQVPLVFYFNNQ